MNKVKAINHQHRGHGLLVVLCVLAVIAAIGCLTMLLWNLCLVPAIGVAIIGYWQALGLLVLCRLLFVGFRPRDRRGGMGHGFGPMHSRWRDMTPEQQRDMVDRLRGMSHASRSCADNQSSTIDEISEQQ